MIIVINDMIDYYYITIMNGSLSPETTNHQWWIIFLWWKILLSFLASQKRCIIIMIQKIFVLFYHRQDWSACMTDQDLLYNKMCTVVCKRHNCAQPKLSAFYIHEILIMWDHNKFYKCVHFISLQHYIFPV